MESEQNQQQPEQPTPEQARQTPFKSSTSPTICKVAAALARAQGKFKPLIKNCEGKVNYQARDGRPAGSYTFQYADLGAVIEATSAALSSEELSHVALIGGGLIRVMLLHSSGEWLASEAPLVSSGGPQQFGSQVTYYRRYLLSPLLGVASEDDDDANGAAGNGFNKTEKPKTSQTQPSQSGSKPAQKPEDNAKNTSKPADDKANPTKVLVDFLAKAGKEKPADVLAWMSERLKRPIKATKELTADEVALLTRDAIAIATEAA